MTSTSIMPEPRQRYYNNDGSLAAGCYLYTYAAGSSTPKAAYTDSAGATPHANPIVLDSKGEALIYWSGSYKVDLKTAAGVQITGYPVDNFVTDATQLRADLIQGTAPAGSTLVTHLDSVTGAVAITTSAYLNLMVKGLKKTFGCVLDGSTNEYTKINQAFQTSGKIIEIEDGTGLCNTALTAPICSGIVGWGPNVSKLKSGTGVVNFMSITGANAPNHLRDFEINGNGTTNARGLFFGNGSLTANILCENVAVRSFTGTGAVGAYFGDIVESRFENCQFSSSTKNMRFNTVSVSGTSTTLTFASGVCELATDQGAYIEQSFNLIFCDGFVFQTNGKEGALMVPGAGANVISTEFNDCYFESNYGNDTANFQLKADGTTSEVMVAINGGEFNGSVTTAKAIRLTGQYVRGSVINAPNVPNTAGQITVDTLAQWDLTGWNVQLDLATVLANSSTVNPTNSTTYGAVFHSLEAMAAFTPVGSTNLGNAALSFLVFTVTRARYKTEGKKQSFSYNITGTLNAIAPASIRVTLGGGALPHNSDIYIACLVSDNSGALELGYARGNTGGSLDVSRASGSNFSAGTIFNIVLNGFIEIQ